MSIKVYYLDSRDGMRETRVNVGRYSDNTVRIENDMTLLHKVERFGAILRLDTPDQFDSVMLLGQYLVDKGVDVTLFAPYFPGARQDRSNDKVDGGDIGFAVSYYASIVKMVGFQGVVLADPHSSVLPNQFYSPMIINVGVIIKYAAENLGMFADYDGVIAPDKGAVGRASLAALALDLPLFTARKSRDVSNGTLSNFEIDEIPPGKYLIVDDICDGGRTFIGLASELPEGVTCDLYVTHGIFSAGVEQLHKYFDKIYTTNSLPNYETDIDVIDIDAFVNDGATRLYKEFVTYTS